jgi:hypothetical protein
MLKDRFAALRLDLVKFGYGGGFNRSAQDIR